MGSCLAKKIINNHVQKFSEMERSVCQEATIEADGSIMVPFQQADGYFVQNISEDMLGRTGLTMTEYRDALARVGQHLASIVQERNDYMKGVANNAGSISYALKNQYKGYDMAANAQKSISAANQELFKLNTEFANRNLGMRWSLAQGFDRTRIRIQFVQANGMFDQTMMGGMNPYGAAMPQQAYGMHMAAY